MARKPIRFFPRPLHRTIIIVFTIPTIIYISIGISMQSSFFMKKRNYVWKADPISQKSWCVRPRLELWNDELKTLFKPPPPLKCSEVEENWVYVTSGTFRISADAVKRHGSVSCEYVPIYRGSDFKFISGSSISPMEDGANVTSDVFSVVCEAVDGKNYSNIHSAIVLNETVIDRSNKLLSKQPKTSLNLSILMFGFDSVSRMTWMRNLPKTYKYIVDELGAVVLEGYNIVGDGTPQALLPILTGHPEWELPEARRGFAGAQTVDGHPWIWKDLQDVGYVTQHNEDSSGIGTFTYRMLGFRDQPTDHNIRTYFLAADSKYSQECLGSVPHHRTFMQSMRDFVDTYPSRPKFSFCFHSQYSHGSNNQLQWADDDLLELLRHFNDSGHLDKSLLVLMSDHGARFQSIRSTKQGKYEERSPFVAVRVPRWFADRYPEAAGNLRINADRLTTPFDLHETFHDVIDFKRQRQDDRSNNGSTLSRRRRGFSLFESIPPERSCDDADIEPHWCSCLSWQQAAVNSSEVRLAAEHVILTINNLTSSVESVCARLTLGSVKNAVRYSANDKMLRFIKTADLHGRVAQFADNVTMSEVFYQVTLTAKPSGALYEATVKLELHAVKGNTGDVGKFIINRRDISRINKYGSQPHCVAGQLPHLRPFCYCKTQLST